MISEWEDGVNREVEHPAEYYWSDEDVEQLKISEDGKEEQCEHVGGLD